ncbi:MAG: DUF1080 domain-containing protein [Pirellulaceae bacterium]
MLRSRCSFQAITVLGLLLCTVSSILAQSAESRADGWIDLPLREGKVWDACNFGGDGEVEFQPSQVILNMGDPMTGIRLVKPFPKEAYEFRFEANRLEGFDFFVGFTFPVAESHCSLILGGWSGSVVGLSNINGNDASDNPTTRDGEFDNNRWYRVRVRVDPQAITAWVDDERIVHQTRRNVEFGIRGEMDPSTPLGISAYQCKVAYRNIQYRPLQHPKGPTESAEPPSGSTPRKPPAKVDASE